MQAVKEKGYLTGRDRLTMVYIGQMLKSWQLT